jgi:OmcA/MtrC family decaheme c-type cytochrome
LSDVVAVTARCKRRKAVLPELVLSLCVSVSGGAVSCNDDSGPSSPYPLPSESEQLDLVIAGVRIASPPVVDFTITNENGKTVLLTQDDVDSGALRFGIAKLVPGGNGDADRWQSYINTVEEATPDVGPNGKAVLARALQATMETRSGGGTLKQNGDGSYRYTFATDITKPAETHGVAYDSSLTHRVAIQAELPGSGGEEIISNPWFDFVPDGGPVQATKNVVHKDACNSCHHRLALHGGGRIETEYCVVCHNPGTRDANSGNILDFAVMIHKIHRGGELTKLPYSIWGFRDSEHNYDTVVYPGDLGNCEKCHNGSDPRTPDGDNWNLRPTKEACSACHDDVNFNAHPDPGIVQSDNSKCGVCHVPFSSSLHFAIRPAHVNTAEVIAKRFQYNIVNVFFSPVTRVLIVDFSVTNPLTGDSPYNIQTHPAFTAGGGASRMAILVGWDSADWSNTGSGAAPAQPISIDPLFGGATPNGNGTYRVKTTLPAEAGGTGVVGIEGHPAVDGIRIPVANVTQRFAISGPLKARRQIVSIDKCNDCHGNLSLHGNNRQGTVEICVICHNANATDMEVRPATIDDDGNGVFDDFAAVGTDGKREESIHFKTMVHAIHAGASDDHGYREKGITVYGFRRSVHEYSHVRYPGILSNCNACHENGSQRVNASAGALATTVETASADLDGFQNLIDQALADPSDDLNISPEAAACASCHDTQEARDHMEVVGSGAFDLTQGEITASVFEDCGGCHGPQEFKDVDLVHDLIPSSDE